MTLGINARIASKVFPAVGERKKKLFNETNFNWGKKSQKHNTGFLKSDKKEKKC